MKDIYILGGLLILLPSCHSKFKSGVSCPKVTSFPHGEVKVDAYNGLRKFTCNQGYKMLGESKQVCGESGHWQPLTAPTCVLATGLNGRNHCPDPVFPNAKVQFESWTPRDQPRKATVICKPGYTTFDSSYKESFHIVCSDVGTWRMQTGISTLAQCLVKRCPIPPSVPHALYRYRTFPPMMGEGSQILYSCKMGYEFVDSRASNMTCHEGEWLGLIPRCVEIQTCDNPPAISAGYYDENSIHARNIFGSYYISAKVTYKCRDGFRLIGDKVLECLSTREWSSIPPRCEVNNQASFFCHDIGGMSNGQCRCRHMADSDLQLCQPFYSGVQVECMCNAGYHMDGLALLTCIQSSNPTVGTWDHDKPVCIPAASSTVDPYSMGDITDVRNHVSTLVIVIATACSVLGILLLIMVIVVFRRRKPRPHLFHPGPTPLPYSRVHNSSIDEHDRLALMAYADATRVHLPTYEEATLAHGPPNSVNQTNVGNPTTEFRPLPSIPPALRTNPSMASDNTNRHSTVTTSTINRDGTSEIFGSLDTVNVSMSDASTSVTVETYDSGMSMRSIASQEATAGSFTTSDDNLANDDAPLLGPSGENQSDVSSIISVPSQDQKEE